ncbi:MAG: hypothetical protein KAQ85_10325 [Thermodesulfovibrionia bacterium]|nr:hypothetical protein [Thermodesulfovibrionia bacterium]
MECNFCGHEIEVGTGKMFVTKRGKTLYFCSNKCEKNLLKLRRKPRRVKWTSAYGEEKAIRTKSLSKATNAMVKTGGKKDAGDKDKSMAVKEKKVKPKPGKDTKKVKGKDTKKVTGDLKVKKEKADEKKKKPEKKKEEVKGEKK